MGLVETGRCMGGLGMAARAVVPGDGGKALQGICLMIT